MKKLLTLTTTLIILGACASAPDGERVKRTQIRDCPPGMVLICETRKIQDPSRGADEEIPEYEFCHCENQMN